MFLYLLLCLLAASVIPPGQAQTSRRECYTCKFMFYSRCLATTSRTAVCADDYSCGNVIYTIGEERIVSSAGCILNGECNRTVVFTGAARDNMYNVTCCNTNYCNGGYVAQAPYITILASLGLFLFYISS